MNDSRTLYVGPEQNATYPCIGPEVDLFTSSMNPPKMSSRIAWFMLSSAVVKLYCITLLVLSCGIPPPRSDILGILHLTLEQVNTNHSVYSIRVLLTLLRSQFHCWRWRRLQAEARKTWRHGATPRWPCTRSSIARAKYSPAASRCTET